MDHVRLDLDPDVDEIYPGGSSVGVPTITSRGIAVPIEAKLRLLSVGLLYEVCRVQKLSLNDLREFYGDITCLVQMLITFKAYSMTYS